MRTKQHKMNAMTMDLWRYVHMCLLIHVYCTRMQVINTGPGIEYHSAQPSIIPTKLWRRTAVTLGRVPRAVALEMSWCVRVVCERAHFVCIYVCVGVHFVKFCGSCFGVDVHVWHVFMDGYMNALKWIIGYLKVQLAHARLHKHIHT